MENREEIFHFTYSAAQRAEIEKIRSQYVQPREDKMEQLRKLDRSVSQKAQAWAIALGVVGALILGTGMSLAMTDLGEALGAYRELAMLIGVIIGVIGLVLVALAYPVYNHVLKKERQRITPEILRLTEELLNGTVSEG